MVYDDFTLPETFEVLRAGQEANLVVTDPLYNVNWRQYFMRPDFIYPAAVSGRSKVLSWAEGLPVAS